MHKFFKSEVGRSMVEMLGVLAIIGVLSIGAVAGYSYAVTKWKAGEVLSDLHTRAIEYTRQMALQKKFTPDFQFENFEFGDENSLGNPVAGFPLYDDPDFFEIEVRGVSSEVCAQIIRDKSLPILDVAVNGGDYGALAEECGTETPGNLVTMAFLFSKTLEDAGDPLEAPAEVTQARPDDCPASRWANIAGVCCAEDERGTGGHCCPTSSAGWGQNVGRCCMADEKQIAVIKPNHTYYYVCCAFDQTWNSSKRRCEDVETAQCISNDDCLANEFCDYVNPVSCTNKSASGVCQPASVSHTKVINGATYKRSSTGMTWWSAENFCARIGGSMVDVADFGCGYDIVGNKTWGYCNEGSEFTQESSVGSRSEKMKLFLSGLGTNDAWIKNAYDTCSAYIVYLGNHGILTHRYRSDLYYYALCRIGGS